MHFHTSLIFLFAFTFFASVQASPVRSPHVVFRSFVLILHSQIHLVLNSRDNVDISAVAVRNENVGFSFFFFPSAIARLIFIVKWIRPSSQSFPNAETQYQALPQLAGKRTCVQKNVSTPTTNILFVRNIQDANLSGPTYLFFILLTNLNRHFLKKRLKILFTFILSPLPTINLRSLQFFPPSKPLLTNYLLLHSGSAFVFQPFLRSLINTESIKKLIFLVGQYFVEYTCHHLLKIEFDTHLM